jgi:acetyltransferase-like isoleucine patch superfamily enzyme
MNTGNKGAGPLTDIPVAAGIELPVAAGLDASLPPVMELPVVSGMDAPLPSGMEHSVAAGMERAVTRMVSRGGEGALDTFCFPLANLIVGVLPATRMFGLKRTLLRWLGFDLAPGCRIAGGVKFYGKGQVSVGADTWIGLGCTFVVAPDASVTIGARCDIAPQTIFHTGSHELGDARRRAGTGYSKPILVGDGSWLGTRCTVLGDVTIGQGSIVAAGAVVTSGAYPANVLLAGCPAIVKRALQ